MSDFGPLSAAGADQGRFARLGPVAGVAEPALWAIMDRLGPSVFVGLLDVAGRVAHANRAALDLIGARLEDVRGLALDATPWSSFSDAVRRRVRAAVESAARGEGSRFDVQVRDRDGRTVNLDFSLLPMPGADGRVAYLIPSARDVSERVQAQHALHLMRFAVDHAYGAMFRVGSDGRVLYANDAACRLLGHSRDALLGLSVWDIDDRIDEPQWAPLWADLRQRGALRFESMQRHADGHAFPVDVAASFGSYDGEDYSFVCVEDLSDRHAAQARLRHLERHDTLTGLANATLLRERLVERLEGGARVALLMVDIDRFDRINEALGQAAGDELLRLVARRLEQCAGAEVNIARMRGDEFALLPTWADRPDLDAAAQALAQRILDGFGPAFDVAGQELYLSCSIGIALAPHDGADVDALLKRSSSARHRAKARGRNQACRHEARVAHADADRLPIEAALRRALERDEFDLHYQPQIELASGRVVGVEALLRWQHPTLGAVSPTRFIPIAEECGLIQPISDWVLRRACTTAVAWQRTGVAPLRMTINLSACQLQRPDPASRIAGVLRETGLDPHLFGVEVTETMLVADFERAARVLGELRALGIEIALDDFGTGYSSLASLRRLPIDLIKIDRSLVPDVTAAPEDVSITRAIISMAHSLHMRVLAEGVETEGQLTLLAAHRCDRIQGFHFCAPRPAAAIEALLRDDYRLTPAGRRERERTLLLVDDEPHIVTALRRALRREGYRILSADSGAQALQCLAQEEVDVIVSDHRMPGMSGVELLRRAKQLYPDTMRLVLSGYTDLQTVTDAINEGAIYKFLTKPWDDAQLLHAVEQAFRHKALSDDRRHLERELQAARAEPHPSIARSAGRCQTPTPN